MTTGESARCAPRRRGTPYRASSFPIIPMERNTSWYYHSVDCCLWSMNRMYWYEFDASGSLSIWFIATSISTGYCVAPSKWERIHPSVHKTSRRNTRTVTFLSFLFSFSCRFLLASCSLSSCMLVLPVPTKIVGTFNNDATGDQIVVVSFIILFSLFSLSSLVLLFFFGTFVFQSVVHRFCEFLV